MFSARKLELFRSFSFRLTALYAGMLVVALGLCLLIFYYVLSAQAMHYADMYLTTEAEECASLYRLQGMPGILNEVASETKLRGTDDIYFRVLDGSGKTLSESDPTLWQGVLAQKSPVPAGGAAQFASWRGGTGGASARVIRYPISPDLTLVIASSLRSESRLIYGSIDTAVVVMVVLWLATAILGWYMARRALAGVREMEEVARQIAGGQLSSRVPVRGRGDEIDQLAASFNTMAQRIETLLGTMRQTNDNIAHELRSPVTRIRAHAELTLTNSQDVERFRRMTGDTIEECDKLLGLINTMLEISEAEAGLARLAAETVDMAQLATEAGELFQPMAEDAGVTMSVVAPSPAPVRGDNAKLQRLVSNLLDNAVKYSAPGGHVEISVAAEGESVLLRVKDTGAGIPPEEMAMVFQRFFRGSQSKNLPGNGLGLSLARAIARVHGAEIEVSSTVGEGTAFTVRFRRSEAALDTITNR